MDVDECDKSLSFNFTNFLLFRIIPLLLFLQAHVFGARNLVRLEESKRPAEARAAVPQKAGSIAVFLQVRVRTGDWWAELRALASHSDDGKVIHPIICAYTVRVVTSQPGFAYQPTALNCLFFAGAGSSRRDHGEDAQGGGETSVSGWLISRTLEGILKIQMCTGGRSLEKCI